MPTPKNIATGSPQILFPVPIPMDFDWTKPSETHFTKIVSSILKGGDDLPLWLGALVDRATRFEPRGRAFAHIRFVEELRGEYDRTLVGQASVATSFDHISHFKDLKPEDLAMLEDPPSTNCFGVAITGPGARYAKGRIEIAEPLFSLRRRVRNKWIKNRSLLLTGGWVPPSSWMGPWFRNELLPQLGLDHLLWWEWSERFPE
jgi:hypothetical protein